MEANQGKRGTGMAQEEIRSQFRIPGAVYHWLKQEAGKEHRSINKQLVTELEARIAQKEREAA